jgi:hypothetical protein
VSDDGFEYFESSNDHVHVYVTDDAVSVVSVGTQGPAGPARQTYIHNQNQASQTWIINHNLGQYPSVVVIDSAGSAIISDVQYDSEYQVTVRFSAAFAGKAYLN